MNEHCDHSLLFKWSAANAEEPGCYRLRGRHYGWNRRTCPPRGIHESILHIKQRCRHLGIRRHASAPADCRCHQATSNGATLPASRAAQDAGATAQVAEEDKQQRYPPAQGRAVTAFAVETWGRLGDSAEELLTILAAEATRHARRQGHVVTASSFMRRWRSTLDASLQRSVASALLAARCGLPGKPHKRGRK